MRRQTSSEFMKRRLSDRFTIASIDEWLDFWDDPKVSSIFYDGAGEIAGYLEDGKRMEIDERTKQEIQEKLRNSPRLTPKLLHEFRDS